MLDHWFKKTMKLLLMLSILAALLPAAAFADGEPAASVTVADGDPVGYSTLEQAIQAANAELGDTDEFAVITLNEDASLSGTQNITSDIYLDLAGHSIFANNITSQPLVWTAGMLY